MVRILARWLLRTMVLLAVLASTLGGALGLAQGAEAAEVFQVRGPQLLQVGDGNRSYLVQLACLTIEPARAEEATAWLRQRLPRHQRVNLRPVGERDGRLVAHVVRLRDGTDLGEGLIREGLAAAAPCDPTAEPA